MAKSSDIVYVTIYQRIGFDIRISTYGRSNHTYTLALADARGVRWILSCYSHSRNVLRRQLFLTRSSVITSFEQQRQQQQQQQQQQQ